MRKYTVTFNQAEFDKISHLIETDTQCLKILNNKADNDLMTLLYIGAEINVTYSIAQKLNEAVKNEH